MTYGIKTYFGDVFGWKPQDIIQTSGSAWGDDCNNVMLRPDRGLGKRKGYQAIGSLKGGYGLKEYIYTDATSGTTKELIVIGDSVYRIKTGTFDITYSGANPHINVRVVVDSSTYHLKIIENNSEILDQDLGVGYDETTIETLSDTKTAVDALTGVTSSIVGDSTTPSAFLYAVDEVVIPSGQTKSLNYIHFEELNNTVSVPLDNLITLKNTTSIRNIDAKEHSNLLFLTDGKTPKVYDGQTIYKAGLPKPVKPTFTNISNGQLGGDISYYTTYEFTDARGKRTESAFSDVLEIDDDNSNLGYKFNLKTLNKSSGYNTNCSRINGNQSVSPSSGTVTLNVVAAEHTIKAGDTALLINRDVSPFALQSFAVDSVTSNTVVLTSSVDIAVTDGDVISNNLRINLYKTTGTEATKYLIRQIVNDSFVNSVYTTDGGVESYASGGQTITPTSDNEVVLSVDDGNGNKHGLQIGDEITLENQDDSLWYRGLKVTNVSDTTITFVYSATETFQVNDNDIIKVVRKGVANTDYIKTQGPPPDSDYCQSYKGNLILAKDQFVYFSDEINNGLITSSQSFPPTHVFNFKDRITGLGVSGNTLVIFGEKSIHGISSRSLDQVPNVYLISDGIGCVSNSSIIYVGDTLLFMSEAGVYGILEGDLIKNEAGLPQQVSKDIESFFQNINSNVQDKIELKRCVGVNDIKREHALFFIPSEQTANTDYSTDNSVVLCFDYKNNRWFKWTNMNMSGGAEYFDGELYWSERYIKASLRTNLNKKLNLKSASDMYDHVSAISAMYELKWDILSDNLGQSVKVNHLRLYSIPKTSEDVLYSPTIDVTLYKNFVPELIHTKVSFDMTISTKLWQGYYWGSGRPLGNWGSVYKTKRLSGDKLNSVKMKLENAESGQDLNISGIELEWAPVYDKQLKG